MTLVCFKQLRHTKSEKSSVKKRRIIVQEQEKYMKEALKEAKKAYEKLEIPVGAIIVKDGKIIARAHNQKETKFDTTKHAEILAIQKWIY